MSDTPTPLDPRDFQFEHTCPDGKTVVLTDSPDGIGSHVYAPHLSDRFAGYNRVVTTAEFYKMVPSAAIARENATEAVDPPSPSVPVWGDTDAE
jgi:hypothetical protein